MRHERDLSYRRLRDKLNFIEKFEFSLHTEVPHLIRKNQIILRVH